LDEELERIKQRRLEEMKRQLMLKQLKEKQETEPEENKKQDPTNQEILDRYFGDRAWEVYNAAVYQYPQVMPQVEQLLVEGIMTGKIRDIIDGAALMGFFRAIGIPVRLQTKIRISEKGELKTLEQKMKEDQG
jgi:DNA-binding TFAR19-related protein (PDSD5 family)